MQIVENTLSLNYDAVALGEFVRCLKQMLCANDKSPEQGDSMLETCYLGYF